MVHHCDSKWSTWLHSPPFPVPQSCCRASYKNQKLKTPANLISWPTKCQKCFLLLTGLSRKAAHSKGEGNEGHGRKTKGNEWDFSSPSWDHVMKCLLTSACMCTEGSQNVRVPLSVCEGVTADGGNRRMCRETPRQTDSWPGRQKKKDRGTNDWRGWKLFGQAYTTCSLQNHYW